MTATFVLYVSLCLNKGCALTTQEFNSRIACQAAQEEIITRYPDEFEVVALCFAKDTE